MNNYSNPVTVTGNPASFEASGNGKLLSLSVPFSPIQDLHGYSSPWPAGGGKNKLPPLAGLQNYKSLNSGWTWNDNVATVNGITLEVIQKDGIPTGEYKITGTATANTNFYLQRMDATPYAGMIMNGIPAGTVSKWEMYYALQASPYTAWGYDTGNGITLSSSASGTSVLVLRLKNNGQFDNVFTPMFRLSTEADATFSPYANNCPIGGRTGLSVYVGPTQDQQDATTYAVDWSTQAGTVYGGTVDVVTGVLTVTHESVNIDDLLFSYDSTNKYFKTEIEDRKVGNFTFFGSSALAISPTSIFGQMPNWSFVGGSSNKNVYIKCFDYTDPTAFKNALSGQTIVYELATPITYQLTATQIALILGQNNVWSDSNEAVTLTYVIELFTRYTFIVNGNDYTGLVERDSYRTAVTPVYGETIQTLDGVGHTALLRVKGSLTVKLNPQTAAQTAAICADLLNAPCEVQYKCLQRNVNVTALMVLDVVSAMFLSRCLYLGQKWNDVDEIVLKEL